MHRKNIWPVAAVALSFSLVWGSVGAEEKPLQSDWLELVRGYRGDTIGVTVVDIEEGEAADPRTITLAIPKTEISDPNVMEEVLVIGKMPKKSEPLDISYEWVSDYDSDNYGLVIRLSKDTEWPIRLYMSSDAGFVE
jgi:hypothetical protein